MAQQFVSPTSESELRIIQDQMYAATKAAIGQSHLPSFKGLLGIISAEPTILTAIHNIKANKGRNTVGSDNERMQDGFLEKDYQNVIARIKNALNNYRPKKIRRVYIPKPATTELRPLGIPSIIDRIIQECVRIVLEPILEAQFFAHSYGFRPMRSAQQALERVISQVQTTRYYWIIEGDISKYFDTINHTVLLKKLYHMGIKDRRVLMIIKQMLRAGVMDEIKENPLGTPQGGIISPLLANVYLHAFDEWCCSQWEAKKTKKAYHPQSRLRALRNSGVLKPGFLVRYADDWVLITNSKRNAERWKWRIAKFLKEELKLSLSEEKTVITDIRKKAISFLGFEYHVVKGKSRSGYLPCTKPNAPRLKSKIKEIQKCIRILRNTRDKTELIHKIHLINSKIRGIIQYYQTASGVNLALSKYAFILKYAGYRSLKRFHGGTWIPAKDTDNLISVHRNYSTNIPAVSVDGLIIGITSIAFCRFNKELLKNQFETPYSIEGRTVYWTRVGKKPLAARIEDLYSDLSSEKRSFATNSPKTIYNFEYYLNRAYAYNRDKGKCKVCGMDVAPWALHTHHKNNELPMSLINKVSNLVTTHKTCHPLIHNDLDLSGYSKKVQTRVRGFREKLR